MSKQAVGAFVRFAAENLVLVNAEHIEKILILACSFRDKVLQHSIELTGVDFEVRSRLTKFEGMLVLETYGCAKVVEARWLTPPAPRVSQKRYRHCRVAPLKI